MNWKDKKSIRWGIIGCGKVTEVKSGPAYQQTEGFELLAVMRRNKELAEDYAKRHQVPHFYSDAMELIHSNEIDAVYIATPPDSHLFYAQKVAEAGKPCCIEKPLAPNYSEALSIVKEFKNRDLPLFVSYYRRSLPRFTKVKSWLDKNYIGEIRHVSWYLTKPANELDKTGSFNWRTDSKVAPAGYFDDLASHGLDLISFLLGDIKEAKGISLNQQNLYSSKDAITACWVHENNISGSGFWNFGCENRNDEIKIFGSKGTIQFSMFQDEPLILNSKDLKKEIFIDNPKNIQIHHVQNMRDQLIGLNETHPSTGQTACHTSWVMDRIIHNI